MILSEKSRAPGGVPWAELKSDEHLWADCQQKHRHLMPFTTICSSESWPVSFIAGTLHLSVSNDVCKSSVELGLVYKTFVNKHTWENSVAARKNKRIHCSCNAGFFGKLKQGYLSLTTKNTLLYSSRSRVPCSAAEWSAFFQEKCPYKEFHPRLCHEEPWWKTFNGYYF